MMIWLGGLAVLTICLRPSERAADLAAVLPRFSKVAFGCVLVLVATGSYQAWRQVGSFDALLRTTYGRVLLVKLFAVIAVVGMGALARRWVQRYLGRRPAPTTPDASRAQPAAASRAKLSVKAAVRGGAATLVREAPESPPPEPIPVHRLQRGLLAEVGIALVVLSMTAALVVSVPARESYVHPFTRNLTATGLQVAVRVAAPRTGDTVIHVTARSSSGQAVAVTRLSGSASLPADKLGPLPLRLANAAGSARTGSQDVGVTFPRAGKWVLALTAETSPIDATVFSVTVPVH
jgi:copper transport protein